MQWRRARDWVVRFGDGTDESRRRLSAIDAIDWPKCWRDNTGVKAGRLLQQFWTDAVARRSPDDDRTDAALCRRCIGTPCGGRRWKRRLARAELLAGYPVLAAAACRRRLVTTLPFANPNRHS